jgi:hypothetical protein
MAKKNSAKKANTTRSGRRSNSRYAKTEEEPQQEEEEEQPNGTEDELSSSEQGGSEPLTAEINDLIKNKVDQLIAEALAKNNGLQTDRSSPSHQVAGQSKSGQRGRPKKQNQQGESDQSSLEGITPPVRKRKATEKVKSKNKKSKKSKQHSTSDEDSSDEGKEDGYTTDDFDTDTEDQPSRQSFGLMVGENLPQKIKEKIKSGKFIEMAELLTQNQDRQKDLVLKASAQQGVQFLRQSVPKFTGLFIGSSCLYMPIFVQIGLS